MKYIVALTLYEGGNRYSLKHCNFILILLVQEDSKKAFLSWRYYLWVLHPRDFKHLIKYSLFGWNLNDKNIISSILLQLQFVHNGNVLQYLINVLIFMHSSYKANA